MINAERAFDALGDPTRRRVFAKLRNRTCTAGELAQGMGVSRPAVSQHLQVLRAAGLVVVTADGTRRLYRVDRRDQMRTIFDKTGDWGKLLAPFAQAAESLAGER